MRSIILALIGAVCGLLLIFSGFNFRFGSTWWIGPPYAYPAAALAGGFVSLLADYAYRHWS
jgi:hypothetical protein